MGQGLLVRRGGQGGQSSYVFGSLSISENGTYLPSSYSLDAFNRVDVNVLPSYTSMPISITENGLYKPQDYNVDAFSEVNVNVGGTDWLAEAANKTITRLVNSNIERVPSQFFISCSQLSLVSLDNCLFLDAYAFNQCVNLEEIYLSKCQSVNEYSSPFEYLNKLSSFYAPELSLGWLPGYSVNLLSNCVVSEIYDFPPYNMNGVSYSGNWNKWYMPINSYIGVVSWSGAITSSYFYDTSKNLFWYPDTSTLSFPSEVGYIKQSLIWFANSSSYISFFSSITALYGENVRTIGYNAFYWCNSVTSIYFPNVRKVNYGAFGSSTAPQNITSMVLGDLMFVGAYLLRRCANTISTIGVSSLTKLLYIGNSAFYGKSSLALNVNLQYCSGVDTNAFYNCKSMSFFNDLDACTSIGNSAFTNCTIEKVIANNCSYVGSYAFYTCSNLSYVELNSVIYIASYAFWGCSSLLAVSAERLQFVNSSAFYGCSSLISIYMPSLYTAYQNAFTYCSNVESVVFDWDRINAFSYATLANFTKLISTSDGINYFSLPSKSYLVGFVSYGGTKTVDCEGMDGGALNYCPSSLTLTNAKTIPQGRFSNNYYLRSIIANECTFINTDAFSSCRYLVYVSMSKCSTIYYSAFISCSQLRTAYFPNVSEISAGAFSSCFLLSSVVIDNVISIFDYGFARCSSITTISIPKLTCLGTSAFWGCTKLQSITLNSVWSLGYSVFQYDYSLSYASITLEASSGYTSTIVRGINMLGTFSSCSSLTSAYVSGGNLLVPQSFTGTFYGCTNLPEFSVRVCNGMTSGFMLENTFNNCTNLSRVLIIDDRSTNTASATIYSSTFWSCSKLVSLYLFVRSDVISVRLISLPAPLSTFNYSPMSDSTILGYYGSIYVNASLLSLYQSATNWVNYSDRLVGLTDVEIEQVIANW